MVFFPCFKLCGYLIQGQAKAFLDVGNRERLVVVKCKLQHVSEIFGKG